MSEISGCFAPHAGVYLQPDGIVRSCCTTAFQSGRIGPGGAASLRAVLDGERAERHRQALDRGDFSLGCWECEIPIRQGLRSASLAVHFDRFVAPPPVRWPKVMDFALSNRCNLQCVMCNGELSSAIRVHREGRPALPTVYDDAFFDELRDFLPHLERAQFKGGEPFLSPETRRVWDLLLELGVSCEVSVTTNGTIWSAEVDRYVRALRMHVIVSVDGITTATLEAIRVGAVAERVWENVDRFQAATDATGAGLTLSFCLMPQNHHELAGFLAETQRRGVNPNVILVNQPEAHDLTRLPADQLDTVVAGLRNQDTEVRDRLDGPHLAEWSRALDHLSAVRGSPITLWGPKRRNGSPELVIDTPVRPPAGSPEEVAEAERLLATAAGVPPLTMVTREDRVVRVSTPPWATPLDPTSWLGLHVDQVGLRVAERLGGGFDVDVGETPEGHLRIDASVGEPPTDGFRLVVLGQVGADGHHERIHLVVPLDPATEPSSAR